MKLTEAAKKGRYTEVISAIDGEISADLDSLLQKVCQDYHTIKKGHGHLDLARALIDRGARPKREMICEAARGGHLELIELLCDCGLSSDLFTAAATGDVSRAKEMINSNSDCVAERDSSHMIPLHYCCASSTWRSSSSLERAFLDLLKLLLDAGSDVEARGEYFGLAEVTPLFYCAWTGGHPGIASELLNRGADVSPNTFFAAVGHYQRHGDGNYGVAEKILGHGFDVNHNDERTALHAFASHEDARGVTWLLSHGAEVDPLDINGDTPLLVAAKRNSGIKVLKVLIDEGASLMTQNNTGLNALEAAREAGKLRAVHFLETLKK